MDFRTTMKIAGAAPVFLAAACLISGGCDNKVAGKEPPPFRIVAKDAGFQAPVAIVAGIRHIAQGTNSHGSWQLEHPIPAMVLWCAIFIA